jgi:hypothetical protein
LPKNTPGESAQIERAAGTTVDLSVYIEQKGG